MQTRRPALPIALAFALGIASSPALPPCAAPFLIPGAAIVALAPAAADAPPLLVIVPFLLGVVRGALGAPAPLRDTAGFASDSLWVGRVTAARERSVRIDRVRSAARGAKSAALDGRIDVRCDGTNLDPGSWILVAGKLEPIAGARNPGRPDPRSLARQDRVVAHLGATAPPRVLRPPTAWWRLVGRVAAARTSFALRQDALFSPPARPFQRALFLGDRSLLGDDLRSDFRDVGAAHLLALSGEHVSLVALFVERALVVLRVPVVMRLPSSFLMLAAYLVLTGAPASVTRAGIAFAFVSLARPLRRRLDARNGLGAALFILLAIHPEDLWDAGLLLSFGATAGLLFVYPRLRASLLPGVRGPCARAVDLATATVAASLPLLPLEARLFEAVPVVGPLTNPILVPWTGLVLVLHATTLAADALTPPGVPAALRPAADLAATTEAVAGGALRFVGWLAARLPPPIAVPTAWLPFGVLYLAGGALLLAPPPGLRGRRLLLLPLAAAIAAGIPLAPPLRVVLFDVGQGDAILLASPTRRVLVDAGPSAPRWDTGERVVLPGLGSGGGRRLDAIILSHADADHCGGAAAVLRGARVGRLYEPDPGAQARSRRHAAAREAARQRGVPRGSLRAGDRIRFGIRASAAPLGVPPEARVLSPLGPPLTGEEPGGNSRSIVLDLLAGRVHLLLTGDLPGEVEDAMLRRGMAPVGAILKVSHHGSGSSSGGAFLRAIRPPIALLSVGERNRYGHPNPGVLARLAEVGAVVARTDREGAATLETDGVRVLLRSRLGAGPAGRFVVDREGRSHPAAPLPACALSAPFASPD